MSFLRYVWHIIINYNHSDFNKIASDYFDTLDRPNLSSLGTTFKQHFIKISRVIFPRRGPQNFKFMRNQILNTLRRVRHICL